MTLNLKRLQLIGVLIVIKATIGLIAAVFAATRLPPPILGGLSLIWLLGGLLFLLLLRSIKRHKPDLSITFFRVSKK